MLFGTAGLGGAFCLGRCFLHNSGHSIAGMATAAFAVAAAAEAAAVVALQVGVNVVLRARRWGTFALGQRMGRQFRYFSIRRTFDVVAAAARTSRTTRP